MKVIWITILAGAIMLPSAGSCQGDVQALGTSLHGKRVVLRNFSADSVTRYAWVDGELVPAPVELHSLASFSVDSVKVKGGKVLFEGQGQTLVRVKTALIAQIEVPMRLEVELRGADPTVVLPRLSALMFFADIKSAVEGLPEPVVHMLPFPSEGEGHTACDCTKVLSDGKWIELDPHSARLVSPTILKSFPPPPGGISSGSALFIFVVSDMGRVEDAWLARAMGLGLDQVSASALRKNIYQPATFDGKPVATILLQSVKFGKLF